jgi:hypothetical protein
MKRWILAACSILLSVFVVFVPVASQESTVAGGQLSSGQPGKGTI